MAILGTKGVLLDGMGRIAVGCTSLIYLALFLLLVIIGVTGPDPILYSSNPAADGGGMACSDPSSCAVTWTGTLTDMTPMHQIMWLDMQMERPLERATGKPALLGFPVEYSLVYQMDVSGSKSGSSASSVVANNVSHAIRMVCPVGDPMCQRVTIFSENLLEYNTYKLTARFFAPVLPFEAVPALLQPVVKMHFRMGFMSQAYTSFELGAKMFFVISSGIIWLAYTFLLFCGPSTRTEEGKLLNSTYEQRYIWWLGLFLILFNDPLFPLSIDSPTIELAGFTAFSTVTFMASLLTYWLVQFDLARLQAERGRGGEINPSDYWNNPVGTCFWLPKVLFASIFWTISLAAYMWQRIMQLTDPAYDITNQSPEIKKWFTTFVAILISFYLLYLFALMVLSCRLYRTMRLANRFVLSITFLTVLMCMIGIFLQAFSPYRSDSALLLTAYGAPNLFVWFLMFAFIPAPKAPHFIVQMLAHGEDPDSLARGGVNADDELYTADTRGVLGGHHDEEDEEHVHGGEEGIDVNVDQGMEDGDGMDGSSGAAAMPKQRGGRRAQPAAAAPAVAAASKQKPGVRGNGQGRAAVAVPASAAGAGKGRARQVPVVVVDDHDGHNDNYDSDYHNGDGGQDAHVADNQFAIQDDGDEGEMDQEAAAAVVPPPVPVRAKPTAAVVSTATTAGAVKQQRPKAASVAGSGKASAFTAPTAKAASGGSSRASAGAGNPFAPSAAVSTASPSSASSAQAEAKPGPSSNPFAQAPQQQPKQHILAAQEEDEYVEREEREEDDRHDNGDDDGQHRKADGGYERDEEVAAEEEADDDDDAGEVQVNIAAAAAAPPPAPAPRQPAAAGAAGKGSKKAGRR